jgi:hypothetical protein
MLYSVEKMKKETRVPYNDVYSIKRRALDAVDPEAYDRIHAELTSRFTDRQIDTSSWIPGKDWTGTVYDPIYWACGYDDTSAALFFGQLVWQVVMDMPDCWAHGKYELDGIPIRGTTYFRIDCPK